GLSDDIIYEKKGRVATVTLNRPEVMNAMTQGMFEVLEEVFDDFNRDDDVWVAILTGAGDKAFCAGADLGLGGEEHRHGNRTFLTDPTKRFFSDIFKPIIGAVNGVCIAGGLEI